MIELSKIYIDGKWYELSDAVARSNTGRLIGEYIENNPEELHNLIGDSVAAAMQSEIEELNTAIVNMDASGVSYGDSTVQDALDDVGDVDDLDTEDKSSIVGAINEIVGDHGDAIREEVDDWLDEHPEALDVRDGSIGKKKFDASLSKDYGSVNRQLIAERVFRTVSYTNDKAPGQSITHANNCFVYGGNTSSDDSTQRISVYSNSGERLRYHDYTSADLFHLNGIAYNATSRELYAAGSNTKLCVIDFDTLEIKRVLTLSVFISGVSYCDGVIYVYGSGKLYKVNMTTAALTLVATVDTPGSSSLAKVINDVTVKDGKLYIFWNRDNQIQCVDIATGTTDCIYVLGEGNGLYPYGEVESGVFVGGQLYFTSSIWYPESDGWINQIFKTNIGKNCFSESYNGQSLAAISEIYVDSNATSANPIGSETNPFKSLLEASAFMNYNSKFIDYNGASLLFVASSNFANEILHLSDMNVFVRARNCACSKISLRSGNYVLREANCAIGAYNSIVRVYSSNIASYNQIYGIAIFGDENTGNISSYSLEACTVFPYKPSDGKKMTLTRCQTVSNDTAETFNFALTLKWKNGETISLTNNETAKIIVKNGYAHVYYRCGISNWGTPSASNCIVMEGFSSFPFDFSNGGVGYVTFGNVMLKSSDAKLVARIQSDKKSFLLTTIDGGYITNLSGSTNDYFVFEATIPVV